MATTKYVSLQRLQRFKDKADSLYVNNSQLTTKLADYVLETELDGLVEGEGYLKETDLGDYAKTADVDKTYAKKSELPTDYLTDEDLEDYAKSSEVATQIQEATNKIGKVRGTATKSQLATLSETANNQDIYVITDDDNHLYMFVGKGVAGADANGFVDLGTHVDLSNYVQSETLTNTLKDYAKSSEVSSTYATKEELAEKADDEDLQTLSSKVSGIETDVNTNKGNITNVTNDLAGFKTTVDSTYAKKSEIPDDYLTDSDIEDLVSGDDVEGMLEDYVRVDSLVEVTEAEIDAMFA